METTINVQEKINYYFTFGPGHYDDNNLSLHNRYCVIKGTYDEAKKIMNDKRWPHWLCQFACPKRAKISKLILISFDELTEQAGKTRE